MPQCAGVPAQLGGSAPTILKPTPAFFSTYALDYDFDADAPSPIEWLRFLGSLWPNDPESIDTLQEFFGYCLTGDTRQQKLLLLIGLKRAGKDTIVRILRAMIGPDNVAGPTLSSLATNFGLWPLIGKPVAIISDARLSNRSDIAVIVERILTITGESTSPSIVRTENLGRETRDPPGDRLQRDAEAFRCFCGTGRAVHPLEVDPVVLSGGRIKNCLTGSLRNCPQSFCGRRLDGPDLTPEVTSSSLTAASRWSGKWKISPAP